MSTKTDDLRREKAELERRREQLDAAADTYFARVRIARKRVGLKCSGPSPYREGSRGDRAFKEMVKWCEDHPE
jgi:hypothetical protein